MIGLGYGAGYNTPYPTMLDRLAEDDYIRRRVFSVGLGGADSGHSKSSWRVAPRRSNAHG